MSSPTRCLAWLAVFCLAASADVSAQYRFDTWTTDNGLPQNGVRQMAQTPDGYLWFTTFDGLVRFDGVRFTTFGTGNTRGIINNRFAGLYGDKDGTLYATTMADGVLTVYRNGVFTSYTSEQVPGHYIQGITPDDRGELRFLVEDEDRSSKSLYYLRNVSDHLARIMNSLQVERDTVTSLINVYMSSVSNQLNYGVSRLTILTVGVGIIAVFSGFYGMNFLHTWPPFDAPWGVPVVLLMMLVTAVIAFAVLRWKKWI